VADIAAELNALPALDSIEATADQVLPIPSLLFESDARRSMA